MMMSQFSKLLGAAARLDVRLNPPPIANIQARICGAKELQLKVDAIDR
jgi:hypothetical protein